VNKGKIIFLNGPSCSGKTTLADAIQQITPVPLLNLAIDRLYPIIPAKYHQDDPFLYCGQKPLLADPPPSRLEPERFAELMDIFARFISGYHHMLAVFADRGCHCLVDHVLQEEAWLFECVKLLKEYPVYFIGVKCDIRVLEQREKARPGGMAREQNNRVHQHCWYDLEVDTTSVTPEENARRIMNFVFSAVVPQAFLRMYEQYIA